MVWFLSESRISLTDLAKREGVNTSTTWRWATKGVKGVRLETFSIGGGRFTSEEAFERFAEATTAAGTGSVASQTLDRTSRQKQRDINASERFLDSESI